MIFVEINRTEHFLKSKFVLGALNLKKNSASLLVCNLVFLLKEISFCVFQTKIAVRSSSGIQFSVIASIYTMWIHYI